MATKKAQRSSRSAIDVGPGLEQVTPVMTWYQSGFFSNDDEARGAFRLAYQQGMDGMGKSVEAWMGLTKAEFAAWMKDEQLPKRRKL